MTKKTDIPASVQSAAEEIAKLFHKCEESGCEYDIASIIARHTRVAEKDAALRELLRVEDMPIAYDCQDLWKRQWRDAIKQARRALSGEQTDNE